MNLDIHTVRDRDVITMKFSGILDETAELPPFESTFKGRIVIDLEKLTMINSMGCRKWIHWIKTHPKDVTVTLVHCSTVVVQQANILQGFVPQGVAMASIYLPYYCNSCDREENFLMDVPPRETWNEKMVADERKCQGCGEMAALDVLKSRYFAFMTKKAA